MVSPFARLVEASFATQLQHAVALMIRWPRIKDCNCLPPTYHSRLQCLKLATVRTAEPHEATTTKSCCWKPAPSRPSPTYFIDLEVGRYYLEPYPERLLTGMASIEDARAGASSAHGFPDADSRDHTAEETRYMPQIDALKETLLKRRL